MDNQTFKLLVDRIDSVGDHVINVEKKVDKLLTFHLKVIGAGLLAGAIVGVALNVVYSLIQAKGG